VGVFVVRKEIEIINVSPSQDLKGLIISQRTFFFNSCGILPEKQQKKKKQTR
jgi:hypothetical protein